MLPGALSPCNKREESLISLATFQLSPAHASALALAPLRSLALAPLRSRGSCTSLPGALPQESPSHPTPWGSSLSTSLLRVAPSPTTRSVDSVVVGLVF